MVFSKVVGLALLLLASVGSQASEWELARDRNGIKVWTRDEPGYPIRAFKAVTTVDSSLSGLVNLIMDTERVSEWAYRILRVEVLARDDVAATFVIRTETDFPWPLSNRDVVLAGQIVQDEKNRSGHDSQPLDGTVSGESRLCAHAGHGGGTGFSARWGEARSR
jgi:hypothetical protein